VREAAEKAKIELSSTMSTEINLPFLASGKDGAKHLEMTLTRAKFDALTRHLVDATLAPMKQAMQDAGLQPGDLSKVLLVGGSSRIPAVQALVKSYTGYEPCKGINPDECVAVGAAIQGGVLVGEVKGLLLLDVTPLSLGIETMGDVYAKIIDRNTTIPVQRSQTFTTAANFQTSVEVNVLQGEREIASRNKSLGKFKLNGIRRALRGVPQIEVTFSIDANGIVNVSAKDLGTGKSQDITITNSSNMSQSEIDAAVRDAEKYAAEDAQRKESVELRNRAEQMIYEAKSAMKGLKAEDKEQVKRLLDRAEKALDRGDDAELKDACAELSQALSMAGRGVPDPNEAPSEDGASDASFTPNDQEPKA
ncbi:MAG: molecular chaperone DnaK, partial [Clostridia bacterium]|nr:molecular chaperone DnaK [Clostridia bacterium]